MIFTKIRQYFGINKSTDKIIFFGSGKVAYPSLKLIASQFNNLEVVTVSSESQKKSFNEVELYCRQQSILYSSPISQKSDKALRITQWDQFINKLTSPAFGIVCSYGFMLPSKLIDIFTKGVIVIHPSVLPKYRGGSPIFHAIANGQATSGVSYIEISKGVFDEGNILHQVQFAISQNDYYSQIQKNISQQASIHLNYVIQNIDSLRPGKAQSEFIGIQQQLKSAPILKNKKINLSWKAQKVFNWSRAIVSPKFTFKANSKQIIIKFKDQYLQDPDNSIPGSIIVKGKKLFVKCGDKFLRIVSWYQPSRQQQKPGIFIAQNIRSGRYQASSLVFQ